MTRSVGFLTLLVVFAAETSALTNTITVVDGFGAQDSELLDNRIDYSDPVSNVELSGAAVTDASIRGPVSLQARNSISVQSQLSLFDELTLDAQVDGVEFSTLGRKLLLTADASTGRTGAVRVQTGGAIRLELSRGALVFNVSNAPVTLDAPLVFKVLDLSSGANDIFVGAGVTNAQQLQTLVEDAVTITDLPSNLTASVLISEQFFGMNPPQLTSLRVFVEITPAPASVGLLGLGGLLAARRRRG